MASSNASLASAPESARSHTDESLVRLRKAEDARGFLAQWLVWLVGRTPGLTTAVLLGLDDTGALVPAAMWPESIADVSEMGGPAQRCADERQDVVVPLALSSRGQTRVAIAVPVFSDDRVVAIVVVITTRTTEADIRVLRADVQWGAGWIDALHRQRSTEDRAQILSHSAHALDMLALVAGHERVDDACAAMACELARAGDCQRVAVGMAQNGKVRLKALSHAAWFEQRSSLAYSLESAMSEAIEQRTTLRWPPALAAEQEDRSLIVNAQKALAGDQAVLTVPILAGTRAVGAVIWQVPVDHLTPDFLARCEALAVVMAPLLARLSDQSRWWAGRVPHAFAQGWRALSDPRRPAFAVSVALGLAAVFAITCIDTTYRVPARANLEGQVQRVIAAPFEGFVLEAPARAGQTVAKGSLLARLDDRELKLEQARLSAELNQQENRRDEAMAKHDRADFSVQAAQVAETQAHLSQVTERLGRTDIVAPFDGVLVSGDLTQNIGAPVEQGKVLFELAPLKGYRVALKVDERDVRHVMPGQQGELMLMGLAGDRLPFVVRHVSVAGSEEGENVFRVEADLLKQDARLRPGMEGVGKIDSGSHSLLWIWTHRAVDWLRVALWRYTP